MRRNDAIKLALVALALCLAVYGAWRVSRWIELRGEIRGYFQGSGAGEISRLLNHGANPNARYDDGRSLLHAAVGLRDINGVRVLLDHGADPNARDSDGNTVLHAAAGSRNVDAVRLLIDKGADVNARSDHGHTPLHMAALTGNVPVAEALLQAGADPNAQDNEGLPPMATFFAFMYDVRMLSFLVDHGADVTLRDKNGNNLIAVIGSSSNPSQKAQIRETVRFLLTHGVRLDDANNAGETAREWMLNRLSAEELAQLEREAEAARSETDSEKGGAKPAPRQDP